MDQKKGLPPKSNVMEEGIPSAKYTRFGEKIRQAIPGPMQCSVGCGGRNCKWENPARWSDEDQAIKGVFSSWVLDNVVAMSRPSSEIIKKYKMIDQFKNHNINSIINLQRPGEHASCGPPLDKESLFTYKPQEFMDNDIFFYNFGWKDYGVTSLHTILDMVKVMSFALEEGRVAVHCHAGLGRTGVLIACYLVFAERLNPATAITRIRKKRNNSIQTRGQIACITEFWQFLRPLRIVFPQVVPHAKRLTLQQFLHRQKHVLHGLELRELKNVPKLVHIVCRRLSQISSGEINRDNEDKTSDPIRKCNTVADIKETVPGAFVNESPIESPTEVCDHRLDFPANSPTDVEAVLSPRVSRRTRSESTPRPQSAGELTFSPPSRINSFKKRTKSEISIKSLEESCNNFVAVSPRRCNSWNGPLNSAVDELNSVVDEILNINSNNNKRYKRRKHVASVEVGGVDSLIDSQVEPIENEMFSPARKLRLSAVGRSEKILPTGSPTKNPQSSAKGKRNTPTSPHSEQVGNLDNTNDDIIADDITKPDDITDLDNSTTGDVTINVEKPKMLSYSEITEKFETEICENLIEEKVEVKFQIGSKEDDVEEVIEISEQEEFLSDNEDPYKLSSSVASKVSWNQMTSSNNDVIPQDDDGITPQANDITESDDITPQGTQEEEKFEREVSASSGRRTPLMYRAEKNIDLLENNNNDNDDIINDDTISSDDDIIIDQTLMPPHPVVRIEGTRSLCDLTKLADDVTSDDIIVVDDVVVKEDVEAARGFAYKLIDDEFLWEKVYTLQIKINSRGDAWPQVAAATDPYVLASLMWSWIEHLSEPLLSDSVSLKFIEIVAAEDNLNIVESFEKTLLTLDEPVCKTVQSIIDLILGFPPLPQELGVMVVNRCIGAMTQTYNDPVVGTNNPKNKVLLSDREDLTTAQKLEKIFQEYLDSKFDSLNKPRYKTLVKKRKSEISIKKPEFNSLQEFKVKPEDRNEDKVNIRELSARSGSSTGSSTGSVTIMPSIVVS